MTMRAISSQGIYRSPKGYYSGHKITPQWMREARMLDGCHPDTGKLMTKKEREQWNNMMGNGNDY